MSWVWVWGYGIIGGIICGNIKGGAWYGHWYWSCGRGRTICCCQNWLNGSCWGIIWVEGGFNPRRVGGGNFFLFDLAGWFFARKFWFWFFLSMKSRIITWGGQLFAFVNFSNKSEGTRSLNETNDKFLLWRLSLTSFLHCKSSEYGIPILFRWLAMSVTSVSGLNPVM